MKRMDVVGCGALNYDRLYRVRKLAKAGTHEPILESFEGPGGSAANTIAHLAALGKSAGFVGAVGRDFEGRRMVDDFRRRKADTLRIKKIRGNSGAIIGFVDSRGERTLYPNPGANDKLAISSVDINYANSAKLVHLSSFVSEKQLREQIKLARKLSGKKISFAPGHLYSVNGVKKLAPILRKTRVLFVNEDELKKLAGSASEKSLGKLHDLGVEIAVVTLGALGCLISTKDAIIGIPTIKIKAVDSTGAGDAFAAGFLAGLLDGENLAECGIKGNRLAARIIRKRGAR